MTRHAAAASTRRPLVAIPARFSASASALRYAAEVLPRALVEAVYAAGGEPVTIHPHVPTRDAAGRPVPDDALAAEVADRLAFADAVLLPGGGDLSPRWTGQELHPTHYDVDEVQDAFDLAVGRWCLEAGVPLLAICRGMQALNVLRGGHLHADMSETDAGRDHRHHTHDVVVDAGNPLRAALARVAPDGHVGVSCYHHQSVAEPGSGLRVIARAEDGTIEALDAPDAPGWVVATQWHPEDTAATDPRQAAIFGGLVEAARGRA